MKITILGSGGGEAYPAIFCNCEHCEKARKAGGKSIRSLSQTLINDDLIIDLPADTNSHLQRFGLSLGNIENALITHAHLDHFYPTMFGVRGGGFSHNMKYENFNIYGSDIVKKCFDSECEVFSIGEGFKSKINFPVVVPFEEFKVGKYLVIALPANHAPQLNSLNYIISDGKVAVLYFVDTGYPNEDVINFLSGYKTPIKCVVMDSTMGIAPFGTYRYHMGFEENIVLKNKLTNNNIVSENAIFIANHITHNNAGLHEEIEKYFDKENIIVAYDGFTLNF